MKQFKAGLVLVLAVLFAVIGLAVGAGAEEYCWGAAYPGGQEPGGILTVTTAAPVGAVIPLVGTYREAGTSVPNSDLVGAAVVGPVDVYLTLAERTKECYLGANDYCVPRTWMARLGSGTLTGYAQILQPAPEGLALRSAQLVPVACPQ